jgi:7,8-dihydropterin-6-yl-methyl-4-(beta-D-ribofuranosyl)aminobenzene 5'-phosphate synthase
MKKFLTSSLVVIVGLAVVITLFFVIRQTLTNAEIEREWSQAPAAAPALETTSRLEILPLYENDRADTSLEFGHGVSYLIRTDSATVLMDLGFNPTETAQLPAVKNMRALDIAWEEIDAVVVSHPHPDHVGGVKAWQNQTITFGDLADDLGQIPIYTPISMAHSGATWIHSAQPTRISRDMATTGVIAFPEVFPIFLFNAKGHEQALVVNVAGQGLVLITGCGHPTLEKLVLRAETLYEANVVGVVGGLHYGEGTNEEIQPHIQFLAPRQPKLVALSPHDSSPEVIEMFHAAFPDAYQFIRVGEAIQFPLNED